MVKEESLYSVILGEFPLSFSYYITSPSKRIPPQPAQANAWKDFVAMTFRSEKPSPKVDSIIMVQQHQQLSPFIIQSKGSCTYVINEEL